MPNNVSNGYFDSLDIMVELVINSAEKVNLAQLLLLGVEGIVICSIAVLYITMLTRQVAGYRYNGEHGCCAACACNQLHARAERSCAGGITRTMVCVTFVGPVLYLNALVHSSTSAAPARHAFHVPLQSTPSS